MVTVQCVCVCVRAHACVCVLTYWWKGMTGSRAGLGAVPRAPSARHSTVQPESRKGGSNWAMSPCSRYRSPPEVELSNIWLVLQLANNEPEDTERECGWLSTLHSHRLMAKLKICEGCKIGNLINENESEVTEVSLAPKILLIVLRFKARHGLAIEKVRNFPTGPVLWGHEIRSSR